MMLVSSKQLGNAAQAIRERPSETGQIDGVRVTAEQCEAAAQILREAEPSVCNGISAERPGFIDADYQVEDNVLEFQMGILTGEMYSISMDGDVL